MSEFQWIETTRPRPRRRREGTPQHIINLLRSSPHQTAVLRSYDNENSASACASTIRLNKRKGFEAGNWDAWVQTGGDGWQVIVVFLGDVQPRRR